MAEKGYIKFWGVRGSLAAGGPSTVKYGGNTPCVEITYGNQTIICDAGSGIRPLGHEMIKRSKGKRIEATILLSHLHLDHVIGLPFFKPIYDKRNRVVIMGPGRSARQLKIALKKIISPPYFPINILKPPFMDVIASPEGAKQSPSILGIASSPRHPSDLLAMTSFKCNHPDNSYAFKFIFPNRKVVVYASDNEPSKSESAFICFIRGADVLIHDAQYTPAQYKSKKGWGHSPYTYPLKIAQKAKVKKLVLFHYDPAATDKELDRVAKRIRSQSVVLAREGMKIAI